MLHRTKVQQKILHRTNLPHLPLRKTSVIAMGQEFKACVRDAREWNGHA